MRSLMLPTLCIICLTGCGADKGEDTTTGSSVSTSTQSPTATTGPATGSSADGDGDGFVSETDCDDGDPEINPGADELCDGIDNDCDGEIDEDLLATFYEDADGDGFGTEDSSELGCTPPSGYSAQAGDCDDADGTVNPDATELCDSRDNDCDGDTDEASAADATTWYSDSDGDGHGDPAEASTSCTQPSNSSTEPGDCDDDDPAVHPEALESCNEIDDDCDGLVDGEDADLIDGTIWYIDADGDGHGSDATTVTDCSVPSGYVAAADDCDDGDASANASAVESCDGVDNDCDGTVDEDDASDATTWYADEDGDGYGDPDLGTVSCAQPSGHVADATDCDDGSAAINPAAVEICGGSDEDCDGDVDEDDASDASTWYTDADSDGYGDAAEIHMACEAPTGTVADATDCDDSLGEVNPAATEVCNELDDDCDGDVDDADADLDLSSATSWYADADSDGFGDPDISSRSCVAPSNTVDEPTDCNDGDVTINPNAVEFCDEMDNDCDGTIDEDDALDASTWYTDADSDGFGDADSSTEACSAPSGTVADATDCDDSQVTVYPDARELYDSLDNDCDGSTDEDLYLGSGSDGALTVSGTTILSTDASNSRATADAVAYSVLAMDSDDTLTLDQSAVGLAAGDEVLIINLQGIDSAYAAVGTYELASILSVSGDEITLAADSSQIFGETTNTDLSDQIVMVQRIPHYTDVTVSSSGVLTTEGWDGALGGVLAFRASGSLTIESGGQLTVDGLGYAGGDTGRVYSCDAFQGESYAGEGEGEGDGACSDYNEAFGHWLYNEGGGGAHVTGGGGNHAGGATDGAPWDGGSATPPYAGLAYGNDDFSTLFFGSGGGGVFNSEDGNPGDNAGPGGSGAGIVLIGAGSIQADGSSAFNAVGGSSDHTAQGSFTYGAGGGAGGSIWLVADDLQLASGALDARGGYGPSSVIRGGGDGGYGRIRLDFDTINGYSASDSASSTAADDAAEPDPAHLGSPG